MDAISQKLEVLGSTPDQVAETLHLLLEGRVKEVPLPLPVQVFLAGFHRGLYPDLEMAR